MALEIEVVTKFIAETTVWTVAYIEDQKTGALDDPTAIEVTITDRKGIKVANGEVMTKLEIDGVGQTGIYEHFLYTDSDYEKGQYLGQVKVTDDSGETAKISFGHYSFEVT